MDYFTLIAKTHNGHYLLSGTEGKALGKKTMLYAAGKASAVVLETIGSVGSPLFLAQPLQEVRPGEKLRSKR